MAYHNLGISYANAEKQKLERMILIKKNMINLKRIKIEIILRVSLMLLKDKRKIMNV
jgi:hypothetical protein